jgi:phosphoglycerate dehydrogenase-like enzyme
MTSILIDVPIHEETLRRLQAASGISVTTVAPQPEGRILSEDLLGPVQVLFCDALPLNFEQLSRLQWIQIASVGYSHLYGLNLSEKGIRATNARGIFDAPIAEWCIAMMINLTRDMPAVFRNQQQHWWDRDARFQSELRGAVLGVYGYGGIGRETARLAKGLGLQVWVLTREPLASREDVYRVPGTGDPEGSLPDRVFFPNEKSQFLAGLDFLLLSLPLTPQTEGIIGQTELSALPGSAYILNPARDPLIDESALIDALKSHRIRGAALDTHYQYPLPPDHPLWALENVILTPHISGSTGSPHYVSRLWEIFDQNISRFLAGRPLLNELTAEELNGS